MVVRLYIGIFLIALLGSCNSEVGQQLEAKNPALGKMNQIIVVADKNLWESAVGDTFRYYFESAYPILPAPEPVFDLKYYTSQEIKNSSIRRGFRTYALLADLSDEESVMTQMLKKDLGSEKFDEALRSGEPMTTVGRNKWAKGQLLIYFFGSNHEAINQAITSSYPAVARRVNNHDSKQLKAMSYGVKTNKGLSRMVKENFGIEVVIPSDYKQATRDTVNNVLWLTKRSKEADMHLVFRKLVYNNEKQLDKQAIIDLRNDFGRKYPTSDLENNYMVVNQEDLPVYEYTHTIDGKYTKELRGVWELTEEFTGGPFSTYVIVNETKKELIYVDAFLLAPGQKKRDYMMQLDYIIKSGKVHG